MSAALAVVDWISNLIGYAAVRDFAPREQDGETRVPGFRCYSQVDSYSCGAVAGFQVVKTFYPEAVFGEFYESCRTTGEGTNMIFLMVALDQHGVDFSPEWHLSPAAIRKAIQNGHPVIVSIKNIGSENEHLAVIYGYRKGGFLLSANGLPWVGRHWISEAKFRKIWAPKGNGIICWPKGQRTRKRKVSK